jgi:hypothetical protein
MADHKIVLGQVTFGYMIQLYCGDSEIPWESSYSMGSQDKARRLAMRKVRRHNLWTHGRKND